MSKKTYRIKGYEQDFMKQSLHIDFYYDEGGNMLYQVRGELKGDARILPMRVFDGLMGAIEERAGGLAYDE